MLVFGSSCAGHEAISSLEFRGQDYKPRKPYNYNTEIYKAKFAQPQKFQPSKFSSYTVHVK